MERFHLRFGVLALALLTASAASAQGQRGGWFGGEGASAIGDSMRGGIDFAALLSMEPVRKEIGLTEAQQEKMEEVTRSQWDAARDQFARMRDMSADERREALEGMRDLIADRTTAMREEIEKILKPEQLERLGQIRAQQEGVGILRRPEVQEQLKMTEAQKGQLRAIAEEIQEQTQQLFQELRTPGADRTGMREKMEALRTDAQKKSMAVLNAEQRKTLAEKIMGKPFELDMSALRRTRPGGAAPPQ